MTKKIIRKIPVSGIALSIFLCASLVVPVRAHSTDDQQADNTKTNKRDRDPGAVTADKQKMNPSDRALTAKIRRAIMADKSLSTYAHNVKIISRDGSVTLKGPVRSQEEIKTILSAATTAAGDGVKVVDQMAVKQ